MEAADQIFRAALDWLGERYGRSVFYVERDVVYTVQTQLNRVIAQEPDLRLRAYNDFPMIPGARRHLSADLAIVTTGDKVLLAAEFKYEPCHRRLDVLKNKLPVTVWA